MKYGKLYPISLGFAWGIISGLGYMLICFAGARWGFALPVIAMLSSIYHNVAPTFVGGLWALFWGFLDFFIFGMLVAFVYNAAHKCCCPAGECDISK